MSTSLSWPRGLFPLLAVFGLALAFTNAPLVAQEESSAAEPAVEEAAAEEEAAEEPAYGEELSTVEQLYYAFDNSMLFLCAILVLFMQAGFAMVESGFNSSKHTVNILFKNMMDLSVGVLLFFVVGFGLMYPGEYGDVGNLYLYFGGVGIPEAGAASGFHPQVNWLFQAAFAATAATIVSGAVAGRMKFEAYIIYSAVITALVYPISGFWQWGGGWLSDMGFHDFAGSLVVHALGGFAGLAGAIVLGPRLGRYTDSGKSAPIPGHNLTLATLGVFILLIGWYGFNPGSQLSFGTAADGAAIATIAVNTTLAAAAGAVGAMLFGWLLFSKPDLSLALNGLLAGLVGITANCDCVNNISAIAIGAVAGVLVDLGIMALDKLKIDDPVGAFPVHGLCGVWGGIAAAIFGGKAWGAQLVGSLVIPAWGFVTMFALFAFLKGVGMLRVSAQEELEGLDLSEHGMRAYGEVA